jgi:RNA polymerase sigma factor (sigma-70 family)
MAPLLEASSDVVDATLVRQSCREPERFAILYDRHFGDVHRYLSGRMGREAADDLAAETFLIAFRKRAGFDQERGAVRPWLFGIATMLVAEHRRAEHRRLNALGRIAVETTTDGHEDRVAAEVTAGRIRPALASAMKELSSGDRDVVFLVAIAGLSYEEVAEALGIPDGTAEDRTPNGRRKPGRVQQAVRVRNDAALQDHRHRATAPGIVPPDLPLSGGNLSHRR